MAKTRGIEVSCWSQEQESYPGRETSLVEEEGPPDAIDLDVVASVRDEELGRKARRTMRRAEMAPRDLSTLTPAHRTPSLWEVSRDPQMPPRTHCPQSRSFQEPLAPNLYLIQGVAHGQVPQEGQAESFPDEVALQQVCNGLVAVELSIAYPCLRQQPVPLRIIRQEDGTVRPRSLAELEVGKVGELMREEP